MEQGKDPKDELYTTIEGLHGLMSFPILAIDFSNCGRESGYDMNPPVTL
jgi:hypothetical protein